eukprot:8170403-Lingulodinium_polyedra.AAC.1
MGPFESYGWWGQVQEAAQEFQKAATSQDPLWQAYLPAVLRDMGQEDKLLDAAFCQELWDHLSDSAVFTMHSPKVGFT